MKKLLLIYISLLSSAAFVQAQPGWTVYNNSNAGIPNATYRVVEFDQSGTLWAGGSYTGLVKHIGTTWTTTHQSTNGLLHDDINDIVIDNSNKVWIGNYKGISVYNGTSFTNYDTNNTVMNGITVYRIRKDNNGNMWISSRNSSFGYQGITTYTAGTWTNITGYPSQINGQIMADYVFPTTGETWVAGNGITKYNAGTFSFYPKAVTGLWSSAALAIDNTGAIWAGGFDGMLKYSGGTWTMFDNAADLGFTSNTLYYDIFPLGNYLWVASSAGLFKFSLLTNTVVINYTASNSPVAANSVTHIAQDASGNLWLSTTIGIVKMDASIVNIEEKNIDFTVSCFPNPANGILQIASEKALTGSLKIYDGLGRMVQQQALNNENKLSIDVSSLPKGLYLVALVTETNKVKTFKVTLN